LLQSRIDEAIAWLEKGRSARPRADPPHWFLAAALGFKGERELARAELAEAMKLTGSDRYSTIARTRANAELYTPALRNRWETVYLPGIRAAGLPEECPRLATDVAGVETPRSAARAGRSGSGAPSSLLRVRAKVSSQSDLPLVIVH